MRAGHHALQEPDQVQDIDQGGNAPGGDRDPDRRGENECHGYLQEGLRGYGL